VEISDIMEVETKDGRKPKFVKQTKGHDSLVADLERIDGMLQRAENGGGPPQQAGVNVSVNVHQQSAVVTDDSRDRLRSITRRDIELDTGEPLHVGEGKGSP
jgi:hypothetical protein